MNNKTVEEIQIKHRGDGCYDIYFDKVHVATKGSIESAVKFIEENKKGENK